jgi:hypothetical protein
MLPVRAKSASISRRSSSLASGAPGRHEHRRSTPGCAVGVPKHRFIPVGTGPYQRRSLAGFELASTNLHGARGDATAGDQRRVKTQDLVDGGRQIVRLLA